jgi:WD40 repeat protein
LEYSINLKQGARYSNVTFSNDGSTVFASRHNHRVATLELRDAKNGQLLVTKDLTGDESILTRAAFSKDDTKIVIKRVEKGHITGKVEVRDGRTLQLEQEWTPMTAEEWIGTGRLAFSEDDRLILLDADKPLTTAWDPFTGRTVSVKSFTATKQAVFLSECGSWLHTPNGTRALCLPPDFQPVASLRLGDQQKYVRRASSIQGSTVAIGNADRHVTVMAFDFSRFSA